MECSFFYHFLYRKPIYSYKEIKSGVKENIYIFDSIIYGDATYIFENDWEKVSKLSKKEIIKNNLAKLNDQSYAEYYEEFIKFQMDISKDLQAKIIKSK